MKGVVGINVNANATITMTAIQHLELQAETQKWSMAIEQQRIIKLLSNPLHHNIQSPDIHKDCYTCVLVELIKGEQK